MSEHLTAERAGERFAAAIEAATDCHQACVEALSWGLQQRGEPAHLLHARLMLDCAQMCDTARDFMLRSSDFAHQAARLCADVCDRCAASCERMGEGMATCAEACRRCAAACRALG
ncbi:MAG TPA: four-helix bundle copper-binding protein [Gaiellales bacterium]|jgi:hypothetical protein|nr:four-helix bundle copper-binding protein [Gaiellales bacterium]